LNLENPDPNYIWRLLTANIFLSNNESLNLGKRIRQSGRINFKWQRGFYDRIIRNDDELNRIREYIIYNSLKWQEDNDNPANWK